MPSLIAWTRDTRAVALYVRSIPMAGGALCTLALGLHVADSTRSGSDEFPAGKLMGLS